MQYWAGKGYFVFFSNPEGGDGRGNEFADIRGKYGTVDYDDLMKFVDEVLARYPQIDPARLGVTGGSYGGFMTNWVIGHRAIRRSGLPEIHFQLDLLLRHLGYRLYFGPDLTIGNIYDVTRRCGGIRR